MKILKIMCIGAVMAILVTSASGQLLSKYEFEGSWNNSPAAKSTMAITNYGGVLGVPGTDPGADRTWGGSGPLKDANIQPSTAWLQVGYDTALDASTGGISTQMTIGSWVKYTSTSTAMQRIMGRGYDWYMDCNTDAGAHGQYVQFVIRDTAASAVVISLQGDVNISDGRWHHVAGTWDTTTGVQNLYVDGILDATQNTGVKAGIVNAGRYAIGARASSATVGTSIYRGRVDDVRVYNTIEDISTVIPEPTTIALLSLGTTLFFRRRRSMK